MDIWILVIVLLVIAIIFFVSSLFAKQPAYDHLSEQVDSQAEQLRHLQKQVNELEEDLFESQPLEHVTAEEVYYSKQSQDQEDEAIQADVQPEPDLKPLSDLKPLPVEESINYEITDMKREEIIRLYSQGYTLKEISQEVDEELVTVQYFIDEYIENR
ncbi:terminase gpP N-terminus-related DNA-binding protein [Facklamia languida]|uniref:Terminase ATPase subunit N-terminal domain-containing protein n=1 Tax=Facklamia languida CCUG 37842 TaxID=883113 RepID=H3NKD0_9LACT|nr:hypothetical protein [Facklamia languida]EHR36647.1 hypothetical protein HMPREF9708_01319 [Facklamia languida CCUG 37842]